MAIHSEAIRRRNGGLQHEGFTLIELMFALAFAAVIILVAAQAFRTISTTVQVVTAMNNQNRLLRSGYWSLIQQADYWDLEANPEAPWCKDWTRRRRGESAASSVAASAERKYHFAPTVFSADGRDLDYLESARLDSELSLQPTQNPGAFLAHDPRQWHRNHLWGAGNLPGYWAVRKNADEIGQAEVRARNNPFGADSGPSWSGLPPRLMWGDYGLHQASEMRLAGEGDVNGDGAFNGFDELNYRFRPLDWDGSLARDSDGDGNPIKDDLDSLDDDIDGDRMGRRDARPWATSGALENNAFVNAGRDPDAPLMLIDVLSARSRAMLQYFQRLHYLGTFAYLPPGTPVLACDQRGDFFRGTSRPYASDSRLASITADANDNWNAFCPRGADAGWDGYPNEDSKNVMWPYLVGGARDWQSILGPSYKGTDHRSAFVTLPQNAEEMVAFGDTLGNSNWSGQNTDYKFHYSRSPFVWQPAPCNRQTPMQLLLPDHPAFRSDTYLLPQAVSDTVYQAVYLSKDGSRLVEKLKIAGDAALQEQLEEELRSVNLGARPAHMPVLKMQWTRMQGFGGATLAIGTAEVADRNSGVRLRLRMSPFGATYRGARQHWAQQWLRNGGDLTTLEDSDGNGPVGDIYVE